MQDKTSQHGKSTGRLNLEAKHWFSFVTFRRGCLQFEMSELLNIGRPGEVKPVLVVQERTRLLVDGAAGAWIAISVSTAYLRGYFEPWNMFQHSQDTSQHSRFNFKERMGTPRIRT